MPASLSAPLAAAFLAWLAPQEIGFSDLLHEMADLERLARWPQPQYRTLQFSSYDRRSVAPGRPDWFSNADGFGGEPIPGFAEVLAPPAAERPGRYLVCDVEGPGAIVRGWSAGMQGVLTVTLDGAEQPLYQGDAYTFLARRAHWFLERHRVPGDAGDAFQQQDADYLPVPFAKRLRITWEGRLDELHFYHLEVRRYAPGAKVLSFDPARDLAAARDKHWDIVAGIRNPPALVTDFSHRWDETIRPRETLRIVPPDAAPAALRALELRVQAADLDRALRGVILRLRFDDATAPQVEAPVGDFFAAGPGLHPLSSLPVSVRADGTLRCRWLMPYEKSLRIELENTTAAEVRVSATAALSPWDWDERSLHFHARWRAENGITLADGERRDLPYLRARGRGRLVGVAAMLVNPAPCPHPAGSWWGEGDEKIFVDGEEFPSFFGTGSEDYFNYSWSRPDLFDHPYCGQPLDSGPANAGYVANYRFHVLDDVPFEQSLDFFMELWPHTTGYPISYARIAYWYARPGGGHDIAPLQAGDCTVPPLAHWEPRAIGGASGSDFYLLRDAAAVQADGKLEMMVEPLAASGQLLRWSAAPRQRLRVPVTIREAGRYAVNLVACQSPDAGRLRLELDGARLILADGGGGSLQQRGADTVSLRMDAARRVLSLGFEPLHLEAGTFDLILECTEAGSFGLDYVWVQARR
ncbi:MAG: DUF2961 domain-containing protein [Planctomycetota bacterium]|nr:MAG: DUF2961 domain-containing protein [Planctomycetota bacterium]